IMEDAGGSMPDAVKTVTEVALAVGGRPVMMTPEDHDRAVARISHAPQILSTALALTIAREGKEKEKALAGSGFYDMTRLAGSQWSVWRDICITNADEISGALAEIINEIEMIRMTLAGRDFSSIQNAFQDANEARKAVTRPRGSPE